MVRKKYIGKISSSSNSYNDVDLIEEYLLSDEQIKKNEKEMSSNRDNFDLEFGVNLAAYFSPGLSSGSKGIKIAENGKIIFDKANNEHSSLATMSCGKTNLVEEIFCSEDVYSSFQTIRICESNEHENYSCETLSSRESKDIKQTCLIDMCSQTYDESCHNSIVALSSTFNNNDLSTAVQALAQDFDESLTLENLGDFSLIAEGTANSQNRANCIEPVNILTDTHAKELEDIKEIDQNDVIQANLNDPSKDRSLVLSLVNEIDLPKKTIAVSESNLAGIGEQISDLQPMNKSLGQKSNFCVDKSANNDATPDVTYFSPSSRRKKYCEVRKVINATNTKIVLNLENSEKSGRFSQKKKSKTPIKRNIIDYEAKPVDVVDYNLVYELNANKKESPRYQQETKKDESADFFEDVNFEALNMKTHHLKIKNRIFYDRQREIIKIDHIAVPKDYESKIIYGTLKDKTLGLEHGKSLITVTEEKFACHGSNIPDDIYVDVAQSIANTDFSSDSINYECLLENLRLYVVISDNIYYKSWLCCNAKKIKLDSLFEITDATLYRVSSGDSGSFLFAGLDNCPRTIEIKSFDLVINNKKNYYVLQASDRHMFLKWLNVILYKKRCMFR